MKIKSLDKKGLYMIICCILSVIITISGLKLLSLTYVSVKDGDNEYSQFIDYNDRIHDSYEDSRIFSIPFENQMNDITRMCVIRNQMETNGKYDANKAIDIVSFANRTKTINNNEPSAKYRLDDLIKWGNYGYDYQAVSGTKAQLENYLLTLQTKNGLSKDIVNSIHVDSVSDGINIEDTIENSMSEAEEYEAMDSDGTYTLYVLVDRYKTVDGKSLVDYASSVEEYEMLVKDLCASADGLFSNYSEYVEYMEKFNSNNTNMLYCYQMTDMNGKLVRFDNLPQNVTIMTNDELSKLFTSHAKYVCFNPDNLQTASNIKGIDAVYMKKQLSGYEYSFGDDSRIWVAIDESYEKNDIFTVAKNAYNKDINLLIPVSIILGSALFLLLVVVIIMTICSAKYVCIDEEDNKEIIYRSAKMDKMPIEIWFIITGVCTWLLILLVGATMVGFFRDEMFTLFGEMMYLIFSVESVLCAVVLGVLYLSLVRKIKCKLIWNGSLTQKILNGLGNAFVDMYDNGQLMARTWLPFLLFLAFNLVMVLTGIIGIIIAFVLDIAVGFLLYRETKVRQNIVEGITTIADGDISHQIDTTGMHGDNLALANAVNSIGDGIRIAVETSMKDEKMKADLITNVSHDIKTPLTSIINFVDLLKRENIEDERIRGYIEVLDSKSQRLKALTNDLVEASKISSGNISLNIEKINLVELINQTIGEFADKFDEKHLSIILNTPEKPMYIMADSRGMFRIVENLYNNIYKYALEGTRVYVDIFEDGSECILSIKNISAKPLKVDSKELTERFIRGDESRRTEGSGLGLSIAKSLTEAQNGSFEIVLDGDLFKVLISFKIA